MYRIIQSRFELGGLYIYRYKKNSIYLEVGFGILFFLVSLAFSDVIFAGIGAFVAFILARDSVKLKGTVFEIKKDRIEVYINGVLKTSMKWNQLEYVTKTRKNAKWVVIGHMKQQIVLKPSIENFDEMVLSVLEHVKANKEIYIHDKLMALKNK